MVEGDVKYRDEIYSGAEGVHQQQTQRTPPEPPSGMVQQRAWPGLGLYDGKVCLEPAQRQWQQDVEHREVKTALLLSAGCQIRKGRPMAIVSQHWKLSLRWLGSVELDESSGMGLFA